LTPDWASAPLKLPLPERLPSRRVDLTAALAAVAGEGLFAAFAEPGSLGVLHRRLMLPAESGEQPDSPHSGLSSGLGAPTGNAQAEQVEHDRYFVVDRIGGDPARVFTTGLVSAYLAAYENCLSMGVTVLGPEEWDSLFGGLSELFDVAGDEPPPSPTPAGWRSGYDPAARWLIGHRLFFALIQGSIIGLNSFAAAASGWNPDDEPTPEMADGLELAASFLRSSAAAMKFSSDFDPVDYDRTVRPDMAPPKVRPGFSGFQTRDHAYLVRLLGVLKPLFASVSGRCGAHKQFVGAMVSAYAAHEFVCARFRGDVLPSLRMAAASRGKTERSGVEVVRELMRNRLDLADPPAGPAAEARP
jgi:hypothetical protein